MIIQYYKGPLYMAKVQIKGKIVIISDSNFFPNGINVEKVLEKDIEKLKKWKAKTKNMTEEEISMELKKDFMKDLGLTLSSEVVK